MKSLLLAALSASAYASPAMDPALGAMHVIGQYQKEMISFMKSPRETLFSGVKSPYYGYDYGIDLEEVSHYIPSHVDALAARIEQAFEESVESFVNEFYSNTNDGDVHILDLSPVMTISIHEYHGEMNITYADGENQARFTENEEYHSGKIANLEWYFSTNDAIWGTNYMGYENFEYTVTKNESYSSGPINTISYHQVVTIDSHTFTTDAKIVPAEYSDLTTEGIDVTYTIDINLSDYFPEDLLAFPKSWFAGSNTGELKSLKTTQCTCL